MKAEDPLTHDPGLLPTVNLPMQKRWARWKVRSERFGWCFSYGESPQHALQRADGHPEPEGPPSFYSNRWVRP